MAEAQIGQGGGFESFHHVAAAEPFDGLGQLVGILLADQPLRSGLHQLVAVASDGEAGDAEDGQMLVQQADAAACGRSLQALHGHVEDKQIEIVAGFLAAFDRFGAGSGRPYHVGGGHFGVDEIAQRFQRARIIVDQRDAMDLGYRSGRFHGMRHLPHSHCSSGGQSMTYTSDGVASSAAYAVVAGAPAASMASVMSNDAILMLSLYGDMGPRCPFVCSIREYCAILALRMVIVHVGRIVAYPSCDST